MCPTVIWCGSTVMWCSCASLYASSTLIGCQKSTPVTSLTASTMFHLLNGAFNEISWPMNLKSVVPQTSNATCSNKPSFNSIMPSRSVYAQYASIVVNSGLCLRSIPSLRKIRPISYTFSSPPTINLFSGNSVAIRK